MSSVVAIVGMGQLGRLFAEGLCASGVGVVPVLRTQQLTTQSALLTSSPEVVLVAVGERDLDAALASIPDALRDRVALLQNDLCLVEHRFSAPPTVAVVWVERKPGKTTRALASTPVGGPHAAVLTRALTAIGLPAHVVDDEALATALVTKNVFIAVTNLVGSVPDWRCETTGALLDTDPAFLTDLVDEALAVETARWARSFDHLAVLQAVRAACAADLAHVCAGRSAPARITTFAARAQRLGVDAPNFAHAAERFTTST